MEKGILYLVATPIGNLDDISYRAVKVLKEVDLIAAEDTRHTLKLLNVLEINKKMVSYHRHNEDNRKSDLIDELNDGKNVAIVTDAGTPAISDPGEVIVKEAIENNIKVVPIPGPCALINALICSGLDTTEFSFYGFLPLNKKNRKERLDSIKEERKTIIIYEAPHRIGQTLKEFEEILGNRNICVAKELTKIHEKFFRGTIQDVLEMDDFNNPKGEYIIIIEGNKEEKKNPLEELSLKEHYLLYKNQGLTKKEIMKKVAEDRGVGKNSLYKDFIDFD